MRSIETRSRFQIVLSKIVEFFKKLFILALLVTAPFAYYFSGLWIASNKHYIGKIFTVRAMNVQHQTVELNIK